MHTSAHGGCSRKSWGRATNDEKGSADSGYDDQKDMLAPARDRRVARGPVAAGGSNAVVVSRFPGSDREGSGFQVQGSGFKIQDSSKSNLNS